MNKQKLKIKANIGKSFLFKTFTNRDQDDISIQGAIVGLHSSLSSISILRKCSEWDRAIKEWDRHNTTGFTTINKDSGFRTPIIDFTCAEKKTTIISGVRKISCIIRIL